jgi:hypothetical protein
MVGALMGPVFTACSIYVRSTESLTIETINVIDVGRVRWRFLHGVQNVTNDFADAAPRLG